MATTLDPALSPPRIRVALDPRLYQIAALSALLVYGVSTLEFDVSPARVLLILSTALLAQLACGRMAGLKTFDPRSPLISGLSLSLLLRTNSPDAALLGAFLAIGSKFVLRVQGKHLFNPTNFGIVVLLALTDGAWVSAGQWGSPAFFAFLVVCLGGLVVNRAVRSDITLSFLFFWAALLVSRSVYLGEPLAIPLHRMESGALLIFAFFMISDPKTTPNSRVGRVLFAFLVALGAAYVQFRLFRTNGLLWSLAFFSPLTPLLDRVFKGDAYQWAHPRGPRSS
jgi:Na+-transporting NADH:ubiquinone oxidoreductase subunit NqrB